MVELEDEISLNSQARRWVFTINNPFGTDIEEIDITNTDLPIREDYYKSSVIQDLENSNCFIFKYIKITKQKDDFESEEFIVKRPFFKDWESVEQYFENIEHRKYVVYQLEKGEQEETEHIQGGIFYTIGKRFSSVKNNLPFAHLEKAKGSNSQVRDYCTKTETRVKGPVELGNFAEERERTDIKDFIQLVQAGVSKTELAKLYPTLYLRERNKIDMISADIYEEYFYKYRSVKVTYIYGPSGVGKTTWLSKQYSSKEAFDVTNYDNSMFTNYNYQDTLIMDEFTGTMKVSTFNLMLGFKPFDLRGLGCAKPSCYHQVYILSNYSLKEIIKKMAGEDYRLYKTIDRRIHKIIHFKSANEIVIERDTEWEDCTDERLKEMGMDFQARQTWEVDGYGNKIILFDRHKEVPTMQEVKNIEMPFKEEEFQTELEF